ncbi:MAG: hypothetical protein QG597_1807 [Actinomycetota bacterium]|nr:hypothetical protein [Actinomycetota bacterium]
MTGQAAADTPEVPAIETAAPTRGYLRRNGGPLLLLTFDILTLAVMALVTSQWRLSTLVFAVIFVAGLAQGGLYRSRFTLSILNDLPAISGRFLMAAGLTLLALDLLGKYDVGGVPLLAWGVTFVVIIAVRTLSYAFIRYMRSRRFLGKRMLIVGCGLVGTSIAFALRRERACGLEPIGFIDSPPEGMDYDLPLPLLGPTEELPELIRKHDAEYVLIAYTHQPGSDLVGIIRECDRLPTSIAVVPRLFELTPVKGNTDAISDIPLVLLRRPAFRSPLWPLKRVTDILISGLALVVLSPLLLMLAIVDRIVDGPQVIFRQERIGIDGRTFELYKFRSLRPVDETESQTNWNIKHDDRVSWFGKLLRKSSLDELPQLFNILRGDMSIVGPRPERPHFVEQFEKLYPYYGSRSRVPCGLTGWAQIHGLRGDTSIAGRARYDNFYIENWSLWLDFKIVLRTVSSLTRGSG